MENDVEAIAEAHGVGHFWREHKGGGGVFPELLFCEAFGLEAGDVEREFSDSAVGELMGCDEHHFIVDRRTGEPTNRE